VYGLREGLRTSTPNWEVSMSNPVRLRVDQIACDGRGLCAELLPELVKLDDWGYPIIAECIVPASLEELARDTVDICPKLALWLEKMNAELTIDR
jgi:ferredoxin